MRRFAQFPRDTSAAAAAEFALIVPLLLLLLFTIIDVGRLMWMWNRAEKATQMGVRYAVVTNVIATGLQDDFVAEYNLVGGDPVPTGIFSSTLCTSTGCSGGWGYDGTAFTAVANRVAAFLPEAGPENVTVTYENVGLGFAGDPSGPDVAALVTVRLRDVPFQPLLFTLFGGSIELPDFRAALTLEDGSGTVSN